MIHGGWRKSLSVSPSYHWGNLSLKPSRRLPLPSLGLRMGHRLIPDEIPWSSGSPLRLWTRGSCWQGQWGAKEKIGSSEGNQQGPPWWPARGFLTWLLATSMALFSCHSASYTQSSRSAHPSFVSRYAVKSLVHLEPSSKACCWLWPRRHFYRHISYSSFRIHLICYLVISPGSSSWSPQAGFEPLFSTEGLPCWLRG